MIKFLVMLLSMLMLLLILLFVFVDFCLLNDVILLEYDVIIKLNMLNNGNLDLFFFGGNVKIKIECKILMNKVILYGNMFIISNVKFGVIVDLKRIFFVFEFDL